ncbi:MAG: nuclear transport factor 2 family protein [Bacteroidota bacterium]
MMKHLIFLLLSTFCASQINLDASAREIAESELSFSGMAVEQGINAAFLEYLADDCVMFNPLPVNGKKLYRNVPERKNILSWKPTRVEIAASGDYGFSTGPWEIRKTKNDTAAACGHFFSIWKKQRKGDWKVSLDLGISYSKDKIEQEALLLRTSSFKKNTTKSQHNAPLLVAEKFFSATVAGTSLSEAYENYASEQIRVYREGHFPAEGKAKGKELASMEAKRYSFNLLASDIATSGDLGYTYGVAVTPEKDSSLFVRVWRLETEWKIVVDIKKRFNE